LLYIDNKKKFTDWMTGVPCQFGMVVAKLLSRGIELGVSANADSYYIFWRTIMATVQNSTASSGLAEVVDRILDKGIVVDAWIKVSLVGIELLSIEARVVIASVETYLKYAEAIGLTSSAATPA
jgi:hypothetical protein